jgi:hypothetical protein
MKQFIYYNKLDSTKEPQGKLEAINLKDAILIASHVKEMSVENFLNIFEVKEYERGKIQKFKRFNFLFF